MEVDILGTKYDIEFRKEVNDKKLKNTDGYAELYTKKLIIEEVEEDDNTFEGLDKYKNKVIRHEIIHAMFYEAGHAAYGRDEGLVDSLSILVPKLLKVFKSINVLD